MEGAVYTVYLKKVRYHTPSRATSSDDEDSISHLEWETVRVRFVKVSYIYLIILRYIKIYIKKFNCVANCELTVRSVADPL